MVSVVKGLFPFIRFTNWKQVPEEEESVKAKLRFPFIRFTNWKQERKNWVQMANDMVSIHTLHELEARLALQN